MKNYLSALTRCLILLLFIISGNPLQAQSNFDAYVITSARLMNPRREETENKLLIYPNPARDYVKIEITGIEKVYSLLVTDITGRIIFSGTQLNSINTSSFSPGIYFVKTIYDGGSLNGSFIINR